MRISKTTANELRMHRAAVRACVTEIDREIALVPNRLREAVADLNRLLVNYVAAANAANKFVESTGSDLRDDFDNKSDRWKESDAGIAADEMISAWEQGISYDAIPVMVLEPDFPTPSISVEELDELPEESES